MSQSKGKQTKSVLKRIEKQSGPPNPPNPNIRDLKPARNIPDQDSETFEARVKRVFDLIIAEEGISLTETERHNLLDTIIAEMKADSTNPS